MLLEWECHRQKSTNRLARATFWSTFHHDGKFSQPGAGGGCTRTTRPPPLKGQCHEIFLTCEYLREFSKKIEMTLKLFSGAWKKVIHEKNLKHGAPPVSMTPAAKLPLVPTTRATNFATSSACVVDTGGQ